MTLQIITRPAGERLVILPEAEFNRLVDASEEVADRAAIAGFRSDLAAGQEELVPAAVVDRIIAGENRIRMWREHRGLSARDLADKVGIAQPFLSQIETGKREGTISTLRSIAAALSLTIDDLVA